MTRKLRVLVFLFIAGMMMIMLSSCVGKFRKLQNKKTEIYPSAEAIMKCNQDLSFALSKTGQYAYSAYVSDVATSPDFDTEHLKLMEDGSLVKTVSDSGSCVYATGFIPVEDDLISTINMTANFDSIWVDTMKSHKEILQMFFIGKDSFIRVYPTTDLMSQYRPKQDLRQLEIYRALSVVQVNPSEPLWGTVPVWDPLFNQKIITMGIPILQGNEVMGVVGCKLSLDAFLRKYIRAQDITGIISTKGYLVYGTNDMFTYLGMGNPDLELKGEGAKYIDLRQYHENREIRRFTKKLMISPDGTYTTSFNGKKYKVIRQGIPKQNWILMKMIPR